MKLVTVFRIVLKKKVTNFSFGSDRTKYYATSRVSASKVINWVRTPAKYYIQHFEYMGYIHNKQL